MSEKKRVFWAYNKDGDLLPIAVYRGEEFLFQTRYAGPLVDADGTHKEFYQVYVQVQDDLFINCSGHFKDAQWFERPEDMAAVEATIMACYQRRQEKGYSKPASDVFVGWVKDKEKDKMAKKSDLVRKVREERSKANMGEVEEMAKAGSDTHAIEEMMKMDSFKKGSPVRETMKKQHLPHTLRMEVNISIDGIVDKLIDSLSADQLIALICAIDSTMGEFDFSMQLIKALRRDLVLEIQYEDRIKAAYDFLLKTLEPEELHMLSILMMVDDTYLRGEDVNLKEGQR